MKKGDIVEVVWDDACSGDVPWTDLADMGNYDFEVRTVGILLRTDRRRILVAQSLSQKHDEGSAGMSIPRGCVREVHTLRRMEK